MAGLLDMATDPQSAMLTQLGLGLLSASGPSRMPVSMGQALGQAGQQGMQGFQQAQENQMRQAQLQAYKRKMVEEAAQRAFFANAGQYMQSPEQQAIGQFGPTPEGAASIPGMQPKFDQNRMVMDMLKTPGMGAQALGMLSKDETPIALGEGGKLVTRSGREIASNPKADSNKPINGYLVPDGKGGWKIDPAFYAAEQGLKRAGASNVSVNTRQESEEAKTVGKAFGEQYADIQKGGYESAAKIAKYNRMEQLLSGIQTGKLTPAATDIAATAESLGIKVDPKLPAKQAAQALANEVALTLRNPAGGAGMPGALSDKDLVFLRSMTPGLGNTPGGNALIIQTAKKLAQRDRDIAKLARDYRTKHGTMDEGFYNEAAKFSESNPLFDSMAPTTKPNAHVFDAADAILRGNQ